MNKNGGSLILCLFLLVGNCFGQHNQTASTVQFSSPQAGIIKVMTFNIRVDTLLDISNSWNSRKHLVSDLLADNAPDVFGIQEGLHNQVEDIQQALPQYANYMAGRSDGKEKGESCAIFYRKDRFTLDDQGTFWFSGTPSKPGSKGWGAMWPRICSWVHLVEKQTGSAFYVYNVHLDVLSQSSREKSIQLLTERIAARKTRDPFIVTGDFNMDLSNPAMLPLQNAGMVDAWQAVHPGQSGPPTHHGFNGKASGTMIDHIPVCQGATVLESKIDSRSIQGKYPSDHFPVMAKISLTAAFAHKPSEPANKHETN